MRRARERSSRGALYVIIPRVADTRLLGEAVKRAVDTVQRLTRGMRVVDAQPTF